MNRKTIEHSTRAGILSTRDLNRALLARQMLLRRRKMSAEKAIEHLVGMQSQMPNSKGLDDQRDSFCEQARHGRDQILDRLLPDQREVCRSAARSLRSLGFVVQ